MSKLTAVRYHAKLEWRSFQRSTGAESGAVQRSSEQRLSRIPSFESCHMCKYFMYQLRTAFQAGNDTDMSIWLARSHLETAAFSLKIRGARCLVKTASECTQKAFNLFEPLLFPLRSPSAKPYNSRVLHQGLTPGGHPGPLLELLGATLRATLGAAAEHALPPLAHSCCSRADPGPF